MKIYLKGNYNHNFIKLDIFNTKKKSDKIFFNIHGLYGMSGDKGSKSLLLGNKILTENVANVVQYSSSRDWIIFNSVEKELSKKAFEKKTFNEERQDLIDAIDLVLNNSEDLFNIPKRKIKLYIVANSLGGTIISSISEKFDMIEKIALCGSGTGASSSDKPILSTYPSKDYIIDSAKQFRGKLLFLQGSLDEIVPLFSQKELFDSYASIKSKKLKIIEGANHNFSSINGKNKKLAHKLYIEEVMKFLRD